MSVKAKKAKLVALASPSEDSAPILLTDQFHIVDGQYRRAFIRYLLLKEIQELLDDSGPNVRKRPKH